MINLGSTTEVEWSHSCSNCLYPVRLMVVPITSECVAAGIGQDVGTFERNFLPPFSANVFHTVDAGSMLLPILSHPRRQ
jgi:hypothetical protein